MFDEMPAWINAEPATARHCLATELTQAIIRAEKRLGRSVNRPELSKRLNVSAASLYAYLNGTTLPRSQVFDRLLGACGITGREAGWLSTLRDTVEAAQRTRRGLSAAHRRPTALPPPRQLPPPAPHFSGRGRELDQLDALIDGAGPGSRTVVVSAIGGMAGVGKTTLALQWCHQVKDRFPDGQLYANLRGFDQRTPADVSEVLHGFLHALGVSPAAIPPGLDAKSALFRSILAQRRILVLADNAGSAEHVRPLLPGTSHCLTVVTSRDRLDGLALREGAHRIILDVPSRDEALTLLATQTGPARVAAEPEAADELLELCGRLPLALSVVAARAAAGAGKALGLLAAELRDAHERLDGLSLAEPDFDLRTIFHWSYGALPTQAARLFRSLDTHPGPDIDGYACAALLGVAAPPKPLLNTLTAAHLLTERSPGRYASHDLLRLFAGELAERDDARERQAAIRRVLDYYLNTAAAANRHVQPARAGLRAPEASVGPSPPIGDYSQAMEWFSVELATLLSAIESAAEHGFESHAWRLAWECTVFLRRTGRRTERARVHRIALDAAERCGDRAARATSLRTLADALARLDQPQEAAALLRESLAECQALGDRHSVHQAHLSFVRLHHAQGRHDLAFEHAQHALRLAESDSDPLALADGLTAAAKQQTLLGHHVESLELGTRALALYARLGHAEGEADILLSLGLVEQELGRHAQAVRHYERSRELDRRLGDHYWEAHALDRLADSHRALGDHARARARREQAVTLLEHLHHPDAEAIRAKLSTEPL